MEPLADENLYSQKEPAAWAHNFCCMAQLVIDTIEELGGSVAAFNRPSLARDPAAHTLG